MPAKLDTSPRISAEAWDVIRGAYDLHVHVAPDIIRRRTDDLTLARNFLEHGLRGFALKSHYVPTAERAKVVAAAVPGITVLGGLTLNHGVGGLNPIAVEIAGRSGCRIVWMPTVDARNEAGAHHNSTGAKMPAWLMIQKALTEKGILPEPISVVNPDGSLRDVARRCLEIIAAYDMVLATGHLSRAEIFPLVEAAAAIGIENIVVTHPLFPTQRLSGEDQLRLVRMGAILEHCYTTMATRKAPWDLLFSSLRLTGVERCILSTDLGQVSNPPVADGFALFAQHLLDGGFTPSNVHQMAVTNTHQLIGSHRAPAGTGG